MIILEVLTPSMHSSGIQAPYSSTSLNTATTKAGWSHKMILKREVNTAVTGIHTQEDCVFGETGLI